jgi:hypothetical protein
VTRAAGGPGAKGAEETNHDVTDVAHPRVCSAGVASGASQNKRREGNGASVCQNSKREPIKEGEETARRISEPNGAKS